MLQIILFGAEFTKFRIWWPAPWIPHQLTVPPRTYHHGHP